VSTCFELGCCRCRKAACTKSKSDPLKMAADTVHVKSLQAHALRSLIIARKKLVGQRVT